MSSTEQSLAMIDTDSSGDISYDELNTYLEGEDGFDDDGNVEEFGVPLDIVFDLYDTDNDSALTTAEIEEIEDHVDDLFDGDVADVLNVMWYAADSDYSDYIDAEEWSNFLSNATWLADVDVPTDD